tara:strand:+ start:979 stop:1311 length:333 start_codon:yes stop_codon:yes gene_type:complete
MAYKKDALLNLGMVDPNQFTNTTGMVDYNRILESANNNGKGGFSSTTQGAANHIYGSAMDKQKSMSDFNSATINPAPLVNTGDVDLNSWTHKIKRRHELGKQHEEMKKEL